MACGPKRSATWNGHRSNSGALLRFMFAGLRTASLRFIRSGVYEIRALRELRRQFPDSGFVFATERGGPFTTDAVNRLTKRIGERAGLGLPGFIATCCDTPAATS